MTPVETQCRACKSARRNPKYFKKAEVRLREMGRRLKGLQHLLHVEDRAKMEDLMEYVDKVQDQLVNLTMGQPLPGSQVMLNE